MNEALQEVSPELVNTPEYPELDELIHTIREGMRLLMEDDTKDDEELLPEEMQRLVFNRQLLEEMEEQIPRLMAEPDFSVRVNQLRGLGGLARFLAQGGIAGHIRQPTGAGKTVLYGIIARLLNRKTLILVPTTPLLGQTKRELAEIVGIPESEIGLIGGEYNDAGANKQFVICLYNVHLKRTRDPEDSAYKQELDRTSVVICDEAHRSLGKGTVKSLEDLGLPPVKADSTNNQQAEMPHRVFLAFTATTELRDKSVSDVFPELIAEENHEDLVKAGILVGYRIRKARKSMIYTDELEQMSDEQEEKVINREDVCGKIIADYLEVREKGTAPLYPVAFCVSHAQCEKFVSIAKRKRVRCSIVTGHEQAKNKRAKEEAEADLLAGRIDMIVTVDLLGEGWDFPPANMALMVRATQSPRVYIQNAGRVARSFDSEKSVRYAHKLHAPYKKEFAYVIEPEWEIGYRKAKQKQKRVATTKRERPVDLASAMGSFGEDANNLMKRDDGKEVTFIQTLEGDADGRALYMGETVICINDYVNLPEKTVDSQQTLIRMIRGVSERASIHCIPNIRISTTRSSLIYFEKDLDFAVSEWRKRTFQHVSTLQARKTSLATIEWHLLDDATDEVNIVDQGNERVAIGLRGIQKLLEAQHNRKITLKQVSDALDIFRFLPVKHRTGRARTGKKTGNARVEAYWKDEVIDKIPSMVEKRYQLDPQTNEVEITLPDGTGRIAIGMEGILAIPAIEASKYSSWQVNNILTSLRIGRIPYFVTRPHPSKPDNNVRVMSFWKDEIIEKLEKIISPKHPVDAVTDRVSIPEAGGRIAMGIHAILMHPRVSRLKMRDQEVRDWVKKTLLPVEGYGVTKPSITPNAVSFRPRVTYWLDEFETALESLEELSRLNPQSLLHTDSEGFFLVESVRDSRTIERIGTLELFAKKWQIDPEVLQSAAAFHSIPVLSQSLLERFPAMVDIADTPYEEHLLRPYRSVVTRQDGTVDLPFVQQGSSPRLRTAITLDAFAKAIEVELAELEQLITNAGVMPVQRLECVSQDVTAALPQSGLLSIEGTEPGQRWNIVVSEDDQQSVLCHSSGLTLPTAVYWVDLLEQKLELS